MVNQSGLGDSNKLLCAQLMQNTNACCWWGEFTVGSVGIHAGTGLRQSAV